uniref:DUF4774 domain-containing protein n=1 Tax=Rhodnius prolixus TaxID=13249 RepID=T1IA73_RHOPR
MTRVHILIIYFRSASLTEVPVLMFFPDYNAYLVPAEILYPNENQNVKRRRPMINLIKLIQQRRVQTQQVTKNLSDSTTTDPSNEESTLETNKRLNRPSIPTRKSPDDNNNVAEKLVNEKLQSGQQDQIEEEKGYTFSQVGQLFQRPEKPLLPIRPQNPQFQLNRPLLGSYFPAGLSGWRPFGNLFQQPQYSETPREHYIQYFAKAHPVQTQSYYYDEYSPRVPHFTNYADDIQAFVNQVQESVMKETSNEGDTSMVLATVPIGKNAPTSLLLRPVAKAVAGAKGVAVASPVAKAVLKKGEKVNIDFDPDAVAIAGPGGEAHAHPKLVISYSNETKEV